MPLPHWLRYRFRRIVWRWPSAHWSSSYYTAELIATELHSLYLRTASLRQRRSPSWISQLMPNVSRTKLAAGPADSTVLVDQATCPQSNDRRWDAPILHERSHYSPVVDSRQGIVSPVTCCYRVCVATMLMGFCTAWNGFSAGSARQ